MTTKNYKNIQGGYVAQVEEIQYKTVVCQPQQEVNNA